LRVASAGYENPYHVYGVVVGRQTDGLLTCIDNWSVEYNIDPVSVADLYDNFNRATLGPGLNTSGTPVMQMNEICGDVQTEVFSTRFFNDPVLIDYYYTAADPNDWESYALAIHDMSVGMDSVGLLGVDSGVTLRASYGNAAYTHVTATFAKTVNIFYHVVAFASNSIIAVELRTFDDRLIASNSYDVRSAMVDFRQFGLLVGRTSNSKLTCADNYALKVQPLNTYGGGGGMNAGVVPTVSSVVLMVLGCLWFVVA